MGYLDFTKSGANKQAKADDISLEHISQMRFSELERRNMAIEIYSEVLECTFWLCSHERMAEQIRRDDNGAVCYTVAEMREIIAMNPSKDFLRSLHNIKSVFNTSKVVPIDVLEKGRRK